MYIVNFLDQAYMWLECLIRVADPFATANVGRMSRHGWSKELSEGPGQADGRGDEQLGFYQRKCFRERISNLQSEIGMKLVRSMARDNVRKSFSKAGFCCGRWICFSYLATPFAC